MKEIGLQLYTVRYNLEDETKYDEIFEYIRKCGYSGVQVYGMTDSFLKMGSAAKKAGLKVLGSTGMFDEYIENPEKTIEVHNKACAEEIGIGGYNYNSVEDVRKFIEKANKFADFAYKHGYKLSYHNHSHEFIRFENGKTAFEMLSEGLDKEKVTFVLDTYWVQHGGADVRYWIEKLGDRISILHLKDMKYDENGPEFAEIGQGNLWWDGIIASAEKVGIKNFVVEQDECDDSLVSIKMSSEYLHDNFIK